MKQCPDCSKSPQEMSRRTFLKRAVGTIRTLLKAPRRLRVGTSCRERPEGFDSCPADIATGRRWSLARRFPSMAVPDNLAQLLAAEQFEWRVEKNEPSVLAPTLSQLQDQDLLRKFYSTKQLRERMVYFWDNHFSTDFRSHNEGQFELAENEAFRSQAFGKFLDLLTASAKSPAMDGVFEHQCESQGKPEREL